MRCWRHAASVRCLRYTQKSASQLRHTRCIRYILSFFYLLPRTVCRQYRLLPYISRHYVNIDTVDARHYRAPYYMPLRPHAAITYRAALYAAIIATIICCAAYISVAIRLLIMPYATPSAAVFAIMPSAIILRCRYAPWLTPLRQRHMLRYDAIVTPRSHAYAPHFAYAAVFDYFRHSSRHVINAPLLNAIFTLWATNYCHAFSVTPLRHIGAASLSPFSFRCRHATPLMPHCRITPLRLRQRLPLLPLACTFRHYRRFDINITVDIFSRRVTPIRLR